MWKGLVQIMRKKKLIQKAFLLYSELEMKKLPNDLQIDQTVTKQFEQELERRLQQQDAQKQFKHLERRRIWKASITAVAMVCIVMGAYLYQKRPGQDKAALGTTSSSKEETNTVPSTNETNTNEQKAQETGEMEPTNANVDLENDSISEENNLFGVPEKVDGETLEQEDSGLQESLIEFAVNVGIPMLSTNSSNVGYSPAALYEILEIISEGAENETKEELFYLLGQSETTSKEENLDGASIENVLGISSSIWIAETNHGEKINVNPEFIAAVSPKVDIYQVDFGRNGIEEMNQWLKNQNSILPSLESEIEPDSQIYVLNTIGLEMKWSHSFDPMKNTAETFYCSDGTEEICEFMNQTQVSRILEGEQYWASSLEMDHGSMFFILPKENVAIQEFDYSQLNGIINMLLYQEGQIKNVKWKIPKIFYKYRNNMKNVLRSTGLEHIFTNESQLGIICDQPLQLTQLLQIGVIELNEYGVNSSSVSETVIEESGLESEEMVLNRPFFYGIEQNGSLMFLGICENPLKS